MLDSHPRPDLESVVAGDPPRLEGVGELATRVRRYLRFLGGDREAAADLSQETVIVGLQRWPDGEAPIAWLLATARNMYRRHLRAIGRRRELVDADRLHELWQRHVTDDGEAERAALRDCLATLPPRSRLALRLRYADELPREGIAKRLALSAEGVKSLLVRVRAAVSECVRRRLQ